MLSLYKHGKTRREIAHVLHRTLPSVEEKMRRMGLHYRNEAVSNGKKGEMLAIDLFNKKRWKIVERGKYHSPYDFIVEIKGETYAINVKYGKKATISEINLERLAKVDIPYKLLFITSNRKTFLIGCELIDL